MVIKKECRNVIKKITFMKMAEQLSSLSYDPKHKVACIIVKNDWTINSVGYNGNYKGAPNERQSLESGKSNFIHAEMNALLFSSFSCDEAKNYTIYVTMTPCSMCARHIVNKEIKNVIALNRYENCGDTEEVFENSNTNFSYLFDLLDEEIFVDTEKGNELLSLINKHKNDKDKRELNYALGFLFEKQMKDFFVDTPCHFDNIYFIKENDNATMRYYMKNFIEYLYKNFK